jgi:hypothetical protein
VSLDALFRQRLWSCGGGLCLSASSGLAILDGDWGVAWVSEAISVVLFFGVACAGREGEAFQLKKGGPARCLLAGFWLCRGVGGRGGMGRWQDGIGLCG